jgi:hypothetical protein
MVSATSITVKWPEDSTCINISEEKEVQYWSRHFQVSIGKLKQTVRAVGPKSKDVRDHLSCRRL